MHFPEALTLSITVAAINISKCLPDADAALLGAIFNQLGDTLSTIAAAKQKVEQSASFDQPPSNQSSN